VLSIIATLYGGAFLVLSGIAEVEPHPKPTGRRHAHA
jgi:hypothetical protein